MVGLKVIRQIDLNRLRFFGASFLSQTTPKFTPEARARAVRMAFDHEDEHFCRWPAISSVVGKIGCSAHTLLDWVDKADRNCGRSPEVGSDVEVKALDRENRELRQASVRKGTWQIARCTSWSGVDGGGRSGLDADSTPSRGHWALCPAWSEGAWPYCPY